VGLSSSSPSQRRTGSFLRHSSPASSRSGEPSADSVISSEEIPERGSSSQRLSCDGASRRWPSPLRDVPSAFQGDVIVSGANAGAARSLNENGTDQLAELAAGTHFLETSFT